MQNATSLTDRYGDENGIWSPCIKDFFEKNQDSLRIPLHVRNDTNEAPWYVEIQGEFSVKGEWCENIHGNELLDKIGSFIKRPINSIERRKILESLRQVDKNGKPCDIAGIKPDFVFFPESRDVCYLVENKPFYYSGLTGNQIANGDYVNLANAINAINKEIGIELKIIFMHPASWKHDNKLVKINYAANGCVYSLLYESIFAAMDKKEFKYKLGGSGAPSFGEWAQYTDLSKDVCMKNVATFITPLNRD